MCLVVLLLLTELYIHYNMQCLLDAGLGGLSLRLEAYLWCFDIVVLIVLQFQAIVAAT